MDNIENEMNEIAIKEINNEKAAARKLKHKELLKQNSSFQISGKKKKQILKERKERKQDKGDHLAKYQFKSNVRKNYTDYKLVSALGNSASKQQNHPQLSTFFVKETKEQIQLRCIEGRKLLNLENRSKPLLAVEMDAALCHPIRPKWSFRNSKTSVQLNEMTTFENWLENIHEQYSLDELNHFEHNLEVWRQLWRVIERSNVIVLVVDIRCPLVHIPLSLYEYVTETLNMPMTIVLNKVDLVPSKLVNIWLDYLKMAFPNCSFTTFSSKSTSIVGQEHLAERRKTLLMPCAFGEPIAMQCAVQVLKSCGIEEEEANRVIRHVNTLDETMTINNAKGKMKARRRKTKKKLEEENDDLKRNMCEYCGCLPAAVGCKDCSNSDTLLELCERCSIECHEEVDTSKSHKLVPLDGGKSNTEDKASIKCTIGLIGHPNVGKSSVLNALAGKKMVSVSKTPGHTKILQTILLNEEICLCDCPGLVFPYRNVPKHVQELCGLYPYAQIREPLSAVRFLAEHIPIERILQLKPRTQTFDGYEEAMAWTPLSICEAYAERRNYKTDLRGRLDHSRAGVEIIKDCIDGVIPFFFYPPDYTGIQLDKETSVCDTMTVKKQEVQSPRATKFSQEEDILAHSKKAPVNAFSLLDDTSSDEDSD